MRFLLSVIVVAMLVAPYAATAEEGIDVTDRVKAFKAVLKGKDAEAKIKAIDEIKTTKHKDIAAAIAGALRDRNKDVKMAAARALGVQGVVKYRTKLMAPLKKYEKADPELLLAYLEGLKGMPHKASITPLAKVVHKVLNRLKEDEYAIGEACVNALGSIKEKATIEELIVLLGRTNPRAGAGGSVSTEAQNFCGKFKDPIVAALGNITGFRFKDPDVWAGWWKRNGKKFKFGRKAEDVNASDTYTDVGYEFRIKKPNDRWTFSIPKENNYVITLSHENEESAGTLDAWMKVEAYSTSAYSGSTPPDRAAAMEQWVHSDRGFKDVRESNTTDLKFAGESAKKWYARGMNSASRPVTIWKIYFIHNGLLFTVHAQHNSGVDEALVKDLEKAIASFKFTG